MSCAPNTAGRISSPTAGDKRAYDGVARAPRFVFFDLGIRHALAGLRMSEDLIRTGAGELFEQWVMAEPCHRAATLGAGYSVSSRRTAGGAAVDMT